MNISNGIHSDWFWSESTVKTSFVYLFVCFNKNRINKILLCVRNVRKIPQNLILAMFNFRNFIKRSKIVGNTLKLYFIYIFNIWKIVRESGKNDSERDVWLSYKIHSFSSCHVIVYCGHIFDCVKSCLFAFKGNEILRTY